MATASVLGVFAHVDTTLQAIRDLRAKGFSDLTVYTPVPVEEIEHEVEKVRPLSAVRLFTLVGALTGTATGFFITIWTSLKWELVTGGKAPVSIPPFAASWRMLRPSGTITTGSSSPREPRDCR